MTDLISGITLAVLLLTVSYLLVSCLFTVDRVIGRKGSKKLPPARVVKMSPRLGTGSRVMEHDPRRLMLSGDGVELVLTDDWHLVRAPKLSRDRQE